MAMNFEFVIIGGGLAAANAMKELVRLNPGAEIGLVGEESELPYNRPPLSKGFLLGKVPRESLFLLKEDFLKTNRITTALGSRAVSVDTDAHRVVTGDGTEIGYGKLLIASGCSLRRLSCPGSDINGLFYLRTLAESEALRKAALKAQQAVVIGAGFIGLEVASVLAEMGLSVTVIHRGDRLFEKFGSEEISSFYDELFAAKGVHTVYKDEAAQLNGEGMVESVTTAAGRTLPCDLAVAGIGVYPDTSYLEGSGLEIGNGVTVDEHLRSGNPDVYAAGDVANFLDPVYGKHRRIEHWDNAIRQGKLAGTNMSGGNESFAGASYFYSTVFGMTFECYGDLTDYDETILRGSLEDKSAAVLYLKSGMLQSAFVQGRPADEVAAIKRLIVERRRLDSIQEKLTDVKFALSKALAA